MMKTPQLFKALFIGAALLLAGQAGAQQEIVTDAVCVDTNVGEFCMRMLTEDAPQTVANFLNYVRDGDFDDTLIHRTVPDFVIQGGGFRSEPLGEEVPQDPTVVNEYKVSNTRGTVAMAKLAGDPNSASNEWFVNVGDNLGLNIDNGGFTVFAVIIKGMDVVDRINHLPRVDLRSQLGGAFGEVPRSQNTGAVAVEDLVLVHRVYITDVVPDEEEEEEPGEEPGETPDLDALTELRNKAFTVPVRMGDGRVMTMTFTQKTEPPQYVFNVETARIILVDNPPAVTAAYNGAAGTLTIPSIQVGDKVYNNVVLRLTDRNILQFTLESYGF